MDGVKSKVSELLQDKSGMPEIKRNNNSVMDINFFGSSDSVGSLKRYSSTHKLLGLNFQNLSQNNGNKRSSIVLNQPLGINKGTLEAKQISNTASFSHRDLSDKSSNAENRYQKLFQKMNKMQNSKSA